MNILITGVGGPLGQSILKAARGTRTVERIIGTDMHPMSVGLFHVDKGFVVPGVRTDAERYIMMLKQICEDEQIAAILIGSEPELEVIAPSRTSFWSELRVVVVASSEQTLAVALDKFLTCQFLAANGLRCPRYALLSNRSGVEDLLAATGFPLIVKPRRGSGSRRLWRVENRRQMDLVPQLYHDAVIQECLLPDDQEYTLGVFTCADGTPLHPIIMQRELAAGLTYRARVVRNCHIAEEARRVATALRPFGPCNLQMRLTESGPVTFEINPRFSSATSMRAHFGYNEVEFALRNLVLGETIPPPRVRCGYAMRFWEELYRDEVL